MALTIWKLFSSLTDSVKKKWGVTAFPLRDKNDFSKQSSKKKYL